jgi:hypothetical protein
VRGRARGARDGSAPPLRAARLRTRSLGPAAPRLHISPRHVGPRFCRRVDCRSVCERLIRLLCERRTRRLLAVCRRLLPRCFPRMPFGRAVRASAVRVAFRLRAFGHSPPRDPCRPARRRSSPSRPRPAT